MSVFVWIHNREKKEQPMEIDYLLEGDIINHSRPISFEGGFLELYPSGPLFFLCYCDPTDKEIEALKNGPMILSFKYFQPVIYGGMWYEQGTFDGTIDIHKCQYFNVSEMENNFTFLLVDALTLEIKAIRQEQMPANVYKFFYTMIQVQQATIYTLDDFIDTMENTINPFSTLELMRIGDVKWEINDCR